MLWNWDLVRAILLAVEELPLGSRLAPTELQGWDSEEVGFHLKHMADGRLIEAEDMSTRRDSVFFVAYALTWEGQRHLDRVRNPSAWKQIKEVVGQMELGLSLESVEVVYQHYLQQMMKRVSY